MAHGMFVKSTKRSTEAASTAISGRSAASCRDCGRHDAPIWSLGGPAMPADRRAGRRIPRVGKEPRARSKSGGWRRNLQRRRQATGTKSSTASSIAIAQNERSPCTPALLRSQPSQMIAGAVTDTRVLFRPGEDVVGDRHDRTSSRAWLRQVVGIAARPTTHLLSGSRASTLRVCGHPYL